MNYDRAVDARGLHCDSGIMRLLRPIRCLEVDGNMKGLGLHIGAMEIVQSDEAWEID